MPGDYRLIPTAADPMTRLAVRLADLDSRLARLEAQVASGAQTPLSGYLNGWRHYSGGTGNFTPPTLQKSGTTVVLQGLVDKNGGNYVANETIFVLPSNCIPAHNLIFEVPASGGGLDGTASIRLYGVENTPAPGHVQIGQHGGPSNPVAWVSLAGIVFNTLS